MFKRILAVLASLLLFFQAVPLLAVTPEKNQSKQEQLQQENEKLEKEVEENREKQNEKKTEQLNLMEQLEVIHTDINANRDNVRAIEKQIKENTGNIEKMNQQIAQKKDKLMQRIKTLYIAGDTSNLEIILGAKDFNEFLDSLFLVKWISDHDQELIEDLQNVITGLEAEQKLLKQAKKKLESEQKQLGENQTKFENLVDENKEELNALGNEEQIAIDNMHENGEQLTKIEKELNAYFAEQKRKAEEKKQEDDERQQQRQKPSDDQSGGNAGSSNNSNNNSGNENAGSSQPNNSQTPVPSGSDYEWPVPGFYHLTSLWEEDRGASNHGALDIASGGINGASVVAAQDGVVIMHSNDCIHNWGKDWDASCGCGGGYGNFVMLDHGGGKATLYAHFSSAVVSTGQQVLKGQVIGYVGSTGHSTGAHLHFETRLYNEKYNPLTEYPGLNYTY